MGSLLTLLSTFFGSDQFQQQFQSALRTGLKAFGVWLVAKGYLAGMTEAQTDVVVSGGVIFLLAVFKSIGAHANLVPKAELEKVKLQVNGGPAKT